MKIFWLLILASVFSAACGSTGILPIGATSETKLKIGDAVTFKVSREGFGEGVIEAVEGTQYKIKYGDSSVSKEESDVYALPTINAKPALKTGEMVVAKIESGGKYWAGAEVLSAAGDVVEVKDLWRRTTTNLSPDKIIVVRPAAAAEFQKLKTENDWKKKANSARPRIAANYKPKTGDRVVAEWSANSWWTGTVAALKNDKATIKWGGSFKDSELGVDRLVPYPKAESAAMPAADSYVLVKPDSDTGQWNYAQIIAVNADSVEVKFPDNKTRSVKIADVIALN